MAESTQKRKENLIKLSETKGFLTPSDILQEFPEIEESYAITEELTQQGIALYPDESFVLEEEKKNLASFISDVAPATELSDEEAFDQYMKRLGELERIDEKTNKQHITQAQQGSSSATERLLAAHQPLVLHCVQQYLHKGLPFIDLVQEGSIGLLSAIKKFNINKEDNFANFATNLIREVIKRALAEQGRAVKIPDTIIGNIHKIQKASTALAQELGRKPTVDQIAQKTGLTRGQIQEMINISLVPHNFSELDNEEKTKNVGENLQDVSQNVSEEVAQWAQRDQLLDDISELPPVDQQILSLHYGLIDGQEWTLKEIGAFMEMSENEVKARIKSSIEEIRKQKGLL